MMIWDVYVRSAPEATPVTTAEARAHLRVHSSVTSEDSRIDRLIDAATEWVQQWTGYRLVTQSVTVLLDAFPAGDRLPIMVAPITSLAIKYDDTDDTERTLAGSAYWAQLNTRPPYVTTKTSWPQTIAKPGAVRVECEVGQAAANIPPIFKEAILHLVEHWYQNPGVTPDGKGGMPIPMGVRAMLAPRRLGIL